MKRIELNNCSGGCQIPCNVKSAVEALKNSRGRFVSLKILYPKSVRQFPAKFVSASDKSVTVLNTHRGTQITIPFSRVDGLVCS